MAKPQRAAHGAKVRKLAYCKNELSTDLSMDGKKIPLWIKYAL